MSDFRAAVSRYRRHRATAKELLEEEALHTLRQRVDIASIDDDILRRVRRDWYDNPARRVHWDWEQGIIKPLHNTSARYFDLAIIVKGQICGLAAARVSHKKSWLSLTHIEGAPEEHPLKGKVLPLVINALYIYRGVICPRGAQQSLGIRVINPLEEAITCYKSNGYTLCEDSKWLRTIVIEDRVTEAEHEHAHESSAGHQPATEDGAGR